MDTMTAVAFLEPGRLGVVERPKPIPRAGEAVVRITTTTICGSDIHILQGRVPGEGGGPGPSDTSPWAASKRSARGWRGYEIGRRRQRHRRCDHAVRAVPCFCLSNKGFAMLARGRGRGRGLQGARWVAIREHDQRVPGQS